MSNVAFWRFLRRCFGSWNWENVESKGNRWCIL